MSQYFSPPCIVQLTQPHQSSPLDDTGTIVAAASCIGGIGGIVASLAIGTSILPLEIGAAGGIFLVGLVYSIVASTVPGLQASDLAQAMADAELPTTLAGAGADLAGQFNIISSLKGIAPYSLIAGGVIGAMQYYFRKYFPQLFLNPNKSGGGSPNFPSNPTNIGYMFTPGPTVVQFFPLSTD